MKSLLDVKKQLKKEDNIALHRKILIYGAPKSGKTLLASSIAKVPSIKHVYWFDMENGIETVLTQGGLTDEELDKIIYIPIVDTHKQPRAAETILKSFTVPKGQKLNICQTCGKAETALNKCEEHPNDPHIEFSLMSLESDSAVVIDSMSQLGDSVVALQLRLSTYKDLRKYYGDFTIEMSAINSAIQAARCTIVAISHLLEVFKEVERQKTVDLVLQKIVPLCGSRNYSSRFGKYFGWQIVTDVRNTKYLKGSSASFIPKAESGNRANIKVEEYPEFDLSWIFRDPSTYPEPTGNKGPNIQIKKG